MNTINTVGMANVIMVKRLKPVHKNVRNDVVMACVVQWNIVIIVLVIVETVLQQNIVEIMSVIMVKHAIHVEQTAIRALMCVEMVNVQAQRIVCLVLQIADRVRLLRSVGMDFVIVCMNHVHLVSKIADHVIILVEMAIVIP